MPSLKSRAATLLVALLLASPLALAEPSGKVAPAKPKSSASARAGTGYSEQVKKWHAPIDGPLPLDETGRPLLVLAALNTGERVELSAKGDSGGFAASDLDRVASLLRDTRTGTSHPVEPRLIDLVYMLETHFQSREVRVVSGYRAPHGRAGSNHGKGRAIDLVVSGSTDIETAAYARTLGFVGVGIYPASGFVHIDVRDRSYFWSDSSGPGRRNRERGILGDLAASSDHAAVLRGATPPSRFGLLLDVDLALRDRRASSLPDRLEEEEDVEPEPSE
jgi:uncharacterized protein YcbK (DUF882 family)